MKVHPWKLRSFNRATINPAPRHLSVSARHFRGTEPSQASKTIMRSTSPSPSTPAPKVAGTDYSTWDTPSLISRITELESRLNSKTDEHTTPNTSAPFTSEDQAGPSGVGEEARRPPPPSAAHNHNRAPSPSPSTTSTPSTTSSTARRRREINPSKYTTRFIALKFAYLGQRYNGYEHANGNVTALPTIEEELWKALRKTRLIFPPAEETTEELMEDDNGSGDGTGLRRPYSISWDGCDYSKCGRTDRGVSAFGQVIGIRVRSAKPKPKPVTRKSETSRSAHTVNVGEEGESLPLEESPNAEGFMDVLSGLEVSDLDSDDGSSWDGIADELPYLQILNNVLPDDIRMLAWCPNPPPDFSARFSCRERQYRYFFTQPAFFPTPGPIGFLRGAGGENGSNLPDSKSKYREGWLDIEAMREGAKNLVGLHDFRNLCKLDTSKQLTNLERRIFHADIELVDPKSCPLGYVKQPDFQPYQDPADGPAVESESDKHCPSALKVYTFTVHGSAFLWHQVRHMVSIIFLIGQGFEKPSVIKELLDVKTNPRRPTYGIASDAPLVLWDCVFPDLESDNREDSLEWIYAGDPRTFGSRPKKGDSKYGVRGTVEGLWALWRQRKIDEILAGSLLDQLVSQGGVGGNGHKTPKEFKPPQSQKVFYGGHEARLGGKYIPVMEKRRVAPVEVQNAKYLAKRKANKEKRAQNKKEEEQ